jgi:RNA polymerase-interacting CarD/CdnL/TRCF family regulator
VVAAPFRPREKMMTFNIGEYVVYPNFGVGRITAVVQKTYFEAETRQHYEVTGANSTLWVPVDESAERGLRRLTHPTELARYRTLLLGPPVPMNPDFRLRQQDVRVALKQGSLQAICEVVRDLNGHSWLKPLTGYDAEAFRKSFEVLVQEWAAVERYSVEEARAEVKRLLDQARETHLV